VRAILSETLSGFGENWVEGGVRISFCCADALPLGRFPACGEAGDLCLMGGAEEIVPLPLFSLSNSLHSCLPRCGYRIFQSHPLWSTLFFFGTCSLVKVSLTETVAGNSLTALHPTAEEIHERLFLVCDLLLVMGLDFWLALHSNSGSPYNLAMDC